MKSFITLLVCFLLAQQHSNALSFSCAGSTIVLPDSAAAAKLSLMEDDYTAAHTAFDLKIRLHNAPGLTEADYLNASARDVRTWPQDEARAIRQSFDSIDAFVKTSGIRLHLPDTIVMIKTTAKEEFGAEGWTRRNRIMLNTTAQPISLHLVAHELWHVISRYNKGLHDSAYAVFHFRPCNNVVYKPALHNRVITNPDCPFIANYIAVKGGDGKSHDVALLLYSKKDPEGAHGLEYYANIGLLELTGDNAHKAPLLKNGEPIIHELQDMPDLFQQIGMNTQYLLHIEEITAEHFAALVGGERLPQMEYVEGLRKALQ